MGKRNYAGLLHDYLDEMSELNDEEFGRLCRMLLRYSVSGEMPTETKGNERFYIKRVIAQEDRLQASFDQASEQRRKNGSLGGRPKKPSVTEPNLEKPSVTEPNLEKPSVTEPNLEKPSVTEPNLTEPKKPIPNPNPNPNPNPTSSTPLTPLKGAMSAHEQTADADFEAFWALYPKKRSKQQAMTAWKELEPSRETISAIMAKLPMFIASDGWKEDGGRWIQSPVNWLKGRYWEQEPINRQKGERYEYVGWGPDEDPFGDS